MKSLVIVAGALSFHLLHIVGAKPIPTKSYSPSWKGTKHLRPVYSIERRKDEELGFENGVPSDGEGKGGPISGRPPQS